MIDEDRINRLIDRLADKEKNGNKRGTVIRNKLIKIQSIIFHTDISADISTSLGQTTTIRNSKITEMVRLKILLDEIEESKKIEVYTT